MKYKLKENVYIGGTFYKVDCKLYSNNDAILLPKGTILDLEPVEEEKTVQSFTEILGKLPERVLTDEEVELLYNNGKDIECDFSGCSTKEKPWPQEGDRYWFVCVDFDGTVDVDCTEWSNGATLGVNDFRTKQEAENAAQKIRELLASLKQ